MWKILWCSVKAFDTGVKSKQKNIDKKKHTNRNMTKLIGWIEVKIACLLMVSTRKGKSYFKFWNRYKNTGTTRSYQHKCHINIPCHSSIAASPTVHSQTNVIIEIVQLRAIRPAPNSLHSCFFATCLFFCFHFFAMSLPTK